jgi:hypothetical protein
VLLGLPKKTGEAGERRLRPWIRLELPKNVIWKSPLAMPFLCIAILEMGRQ